MRGVHYLTTIDRKLALLEQLGADLVYLVDFTAKLGSLSPEEFVSDYLVRMHAVAVVAGFDHTYGKKGRRHDGPLGGVRGRPF